MKLKFFTILGLGSFSVNAELQESNLIFLQNMLGKYVNLHKGQLQSNHAVKTGDLWKNYNMGSHQGTHDRREQAPKAFRTAKNSRKISRLPKMNQRQRSKVDNSRNGKSFWKFY